MCAVRVGPGIADAVCSGASAVYQSADRFAAGHCDRNGATGGRTSGPSAAESAGRNPDALLFMASSGAGNPDRRGYHDCLSDRNGNRRSWNSQHHGIFGTDAGKAASRI